MPDTLTHSQTTEYSATQLLYSIQFKLSHAIISMALPTNNFEVKNMGLTMIPLFIVQGAILPIGKGK